jgi:hypothetical protein
VIDGFVLTESQWRSLEVVGIYFAGLGSLVASITALYIAAKQSRRTLTITQVFSRRDAFPHREYDDLLVLANTSQNPVWVDKVHMVVWPILRRRIVRERAWGGHPELPIEIKSGQSVRLRFSAVEDGRAEITKDLASRYQGFWAWYRRATIGFAYWNIYLSTGERFRSFLSDGFIDQVESHFKIAST